MLSAFAYDLSVMRDELFSKLSGQGTEARRPKIMGVQRALSIIQRSISDANVFLVAVCVCGFSDLYTKGSRVLSCSNVVLVTVSASTVST